MLKNTVVDLYGVDLVNYNSIFGDVSVDVLNEVYDLNLIIDDCININDKHVRRSLTHNSLAHVTNYVLDNHDTTARPVFVYNTDEIRHIELFNYIEPDRLLLYLERFAKKLMRLIGVSLMHVPCTYDSFMGLVSDRDGDAVDMLYGTLKKAKPCSLYELHKFVIAQGLTGLQDKFFNSQQFKKILI